MLAAATALAMALVVAVVASLRDRLGWGYLLSTDVDGVADARLAEPALSLPLLYVLAAALTGAAVALGLPAGHGPLDRTGLGLMATAFVALTVWDMRRRRGTVAVYITLRRAELGFTPRGGVIEAPKLMFLVMNQPTPLVWPATAVALIAASVLIAPRQSWVAVVPVSAIGALLVWLWVRNRHSPWERLAHRLRWQSFRDGERLVEELESALALDPEVAIVRRAADAMVARVVSGGRSPRD